MEILKPLFEGIAVAMSRLVYGPWREVFVGTFTECDEAVRDLWGFSTKVREVREGRWAIYVRARKVDADRSSSRQALKDSGERLVG